MHSDWIIRENEKCIQQMMWFSTSVQNWQRVKKPFSSACQCISTSWADTCMHLSIFRETDFECATKSKQKKSDGLSSLKPNFEGKIKKLRQHVNYNQNKWSRMWFLVIVETTKCMTQHTEHNKLSKYKQEKEREKNLF